MRLSWNWNLLFDCIVSFLLLAFIVVIKLGELDLFLKSVLRVLMI